MRAFVRAKYLNKSQNSRLKKCPSYGHYGTGISHTGHHTRTENSLSRDLPINCKK